MDADARGILVEETPKITFNFSLTGAMGCKLLLSSISEPAPPTHQCSGLIPLPMNMAANRFGNA